MIRPTSVLCYIARLVQASPPKRLLKKRSTVDDGHLRRLVRLAPNERADARDLWAYTQDLRYTKIQGPLLAYLLPFCLEAWRDDLRGFDSGYGWDLSNTCTLFWRIATFRYAFDLKQIEGCLDLHARCHSGRNRMINEYSPTGNERATEPLDSGADE